MLDKKLGDIFSQDISTKFTNYLTKHNSILIQRLLNEKDDKKRICFQKLFNITFLQCLKYFNGTEHYEELEGFQQFNDIKHKYANDPKYLFELEAHLNNYDKIINEKLNKKNHKKLFNTKNQIKK